MNDPKLGSRIAALRKARGMTQQQLADLLHVSNKAVSRWEREESAPDLYLIPKLADIFGTTCDDLLRGESPTPQSDTPDAASNITPPPGRLQLYTAISCSLILMGLMAAMICYLTLSWRFGPLGFSLELAFCLLAGICQTVGTLNSPEDLRVKKEYAANLSILALTQISGSCLIVNSSLDIEEILLLGIPLASIVLALGLCVKWFLIVPDQKFHSLRKSFAANATITLIATGIFAMLITVSTDISAGLMLGLLLTPIEIAIALGIYRYEKKKLMTNAV